MTRHRVTDTEFAAALAAGRVTEDEAFVRMAGIEALRDAGFDVMEAEEHADGAVRILEVQAATIIALLIASGRGRTHGTALPAKSRFLEKPYCHDHVVSHIRELAVS